MCSRCRRSQAQVHHPHLLSRLIQKAALSFVRFSKKEGLHAIQASGLGECLELLPTQNVGLVFCERRLGGRHVPRADHRDPNAKPQSSSYRYFASRGLG